MWFVQSAVARPERLLRLGARLNCSSSGATLQVSTHAPSTYTGIPTSLVGPKVSTAAEEAAHGVHAPTEDVLAKRPNWQA